jgi:hypothetical protein
MLTQHTKRAWVSLSCNWSGKDQNSCLEKTEPKVVFGDAVPKNPITGGNLRNIQGSRRVRSSLLKIVVRCLWVFALRHGEIFTRILGCFSMEELFLERKKVKQ